MQLAFVVADLDQALDHWTQQLGVGPFVVFETSLGDRRSIYRGQESRADMAMAFAYINDLQIEIVSPVDEHPSLYREFLQNGQSGLHHFGFWPEEFTLSCAAAQACGFVESSRLVTKDGDLNAIYYDAPKSIGTAVELVPMTDARRAYFDQIKALSIDWDGRDPIRRYADRTAFLSAIL